MKNIIVIAAFLLPLPATPFSQDRPSSSPHSELDELKEALKSDSLLSLWVNEGGGPVALYETFKKNIWKADSVWEYHQTNLRPLPDVGSTRRFGLLPAVTPGA